jgi:hypothetical protein
MSWRPRTWLLGEGGGGTWSTLCSAERDGERPDARARELHVDREHRQPERRDNPLPQVMVGRAFVDRPQHAGAGDQATGAREHAQADPRPRSDDAVQRQCGGEQHHEREERGLNCARHRHVDGGEAGHGRPSARIERSTSP